MRAVSNTSVNNVQHVTKKSTQRKSEILFFKHSHSIRLFSNSFTTNISLKIKSCRTFLLFDYHQGRVENIFSHKTHYCTYIQHIYIDIYGIYRQRDRQIQIHMQYTLMHMHIRIFLEYIPSMQSFHRESIFNMLHIF